MSNDADVRNSVNDRANHFEIILNHYWDRSRTEYLTELREYHKHKKNSQNSQNTN